MSCLSEYFFNLASKHWSISNREQVVWKPYCYLWATPDFSVSLNQGFFYLRLMGANKAKQRGTVKLRQQGRAFVVKCDKSLISLSFDLSPLRT